MRWPLEILKHNSGELNSCEIVTYASNSECLVELHMADATLMRRQGIDYEGALFGLREELDSSSILVLCNRFRRDAFTTSMSRQMSQGLKCYIVRPHRPVDPRKLVDCLAAAMRRDVVTAKESAQFIEQWKLRPPSSARLIWQAITKSSRE